MDLELLIDKIDFSQGARQIAKQALELGIKYQKEDAWHPVEELPEHNRRIVGLTKVRKRFKHLNFLGEEWWKKFTKSNAIYKWAYVEDLI